MRPIRNLQCRRSAPSWHLRCSPRTIAGPAIEGIEGVKDADPDQRMRPAALAEGELSYCTVTASNFRALSRRKIPVFRAGVFHCWTIHSSIVGSSSRHTRAAAARRLAIAWSEVVPECWEPASSPGERLAQGVQGRCDRHDRRRHDLALERHRVQRRMTEDLTSVGRTAC